MINRGIKDPSVTLESSRELSGIIIPIKTDPERLRARSRPGHPAAFSGPSEQSQLGQEGEGGEFPQQSPRNQGRAEGEAVPGWEGSVSLPGRERTRR